MNSTISLHTIPALQEINVRDKVKLRPLIQSDAEQLLQILAKDHNIREKVTVASRLHSAEDVAEEIKRYRSDTGLIRYTLLLDENPVGLVSLWRDDGFWGKKNLDDYGFGFFLDPKERGKGLVTSAVKKLLEIVPQNIHVNQFVAFCEDENKQSLVVLKKLGFESTDQTLREPNNGWIERKYIKRVS